MWLPLSYKNISVSSAAPASNCLSLDITNKPRLGKICKVLLLLVPALNFPNVFILPTESIATSLRLGDSMSLTSLGSELLLSPPWKPSILKVCLGTIYP